MKDSFFEQILTMALQEDLGDVGDVTSRAIFSDHMTNAVLYSKDRGILAGAHFFRQVFNYVDSTLKVELLKNDGHILENGDKIALISGKTSSILEGERTAINFLSFLSGIASETDRCVMAAGETGGAVILDTRKTLPGYRSLSKYAVSVGGGTNHRMGLYDMVMIKDNHIDAAGSITSAVEKVRAKWGDAFEIEVECRNGDEVREAVSLGVERIMLDNMNPRETAEAVRLGNGKVLFEASGNMDCAKIREYSPTGIHFISVGGLTHSVKAFDFSLRIG